MSWRELNADQLNKLRHPLIVDVRSPCEHEEERIVGSVNIPLLSNEERVQVGTVYAQNGEMQARRLAVNIISPKIPDIIDQIFALRRSGQALVVHCWRGGLRSEVVASMLSVVGLECFRLTGGYKAWRKQVLTDFQNDFYEFQLIVLHGFTGVGKTEVLRELKKSGQNVLDLESLANHRGSVFGGMGLGVQPTQKNFEAELWQCLDSFDCKLVFVEAESRKIGKLALPDCVFNRIQSGVPILVNGSMDSRANRIIDDYCQIGSESAEEAKRSLLQLKERLGRRKAQELQELFEQDRRQEAVRELLMHYYDPLYTKEIERHRPFAFEVCADNPVQAAAQILQWAEALQSGSANSPSHVPVIRQTSASSIN